MTDAMPTPAASYGSVLDPEALARNIQDDLDAEDDLNADLGFLERTAPYVAEFWGTFLIVFTLGCCHIAGEPTWSPTGLACMVVVVIYALSPVSGAHLNPAVTLSRCLSGNLSLKLMPFYMLAQFVGGLSGNFACIGLFNAKVAPKLAAGKPFNLFHVAIVELIFTTMFCFVVLNCMASTRNNRKSDQNHFFALAIGFVYIAAGTAAQQISGGLLNPAASLAIGIANQEWLEILVYGGAQFAAAWGAAFLFAIVRPEDFSFQHEGSLEDFEVPFRAKVMSELIGTFMVVTTVGLNAVALHASTGAWSSAAAYISMIYALGDVSGAHFNPSVTLAAVLTRRSVCQMYLGISYILNQLIGCGLAGLLCAHFRNVVAHAAKHTGDKYPDNLGPRAGYGWLQACTAEVLFTAFLCFAYLVAATTTMPPSLTKTKFYFGLVIGSVIAIGGIAIGAVTDATLNPACAAADLLAYHVELFFSKGPIKWVHLFEKLGKSMAFTAIELSGGVLAALLFAVTHQGEYHKDGTGYTHVP